MPAARTVTPSPPASIHTVEVVEEVDDRASDANERTSLLRTSSRNSGAKIYVNSKHGRVAKPASAARRPPTVEQEAVKVQQGQRVSLSFSSPPTATMSLSCSKLIRNRVRSQRILTSIPMQILFFGILATTFASLAMALVLALNAAYDFTSALLPYRGSGMLEVWIAALGAVSTHSFIQHALKDLSLAHLEWWMSVVHRVPIPRLLRLARLPHLPCQPPLPTPPRRLVPDDHDLPSSPQSALPSHVRPPRSHRPDLHPGSPFFLRGKEGQGYRGKETHAGPRRTTCRGRDERTRTGECVREEGGAEGARGGDCAGFGGHAGEWVLEGSG